MTTSDRHLTNYVLHAKSDQFHWEGTGQLSLKTFRNGQAYYKTNNGYFAVEEQRYLLLNEGNEGTQMNSYNDHSSNINSKMIQKVGQIGIPVQDISRATSFYKETLELPLLFDTPTMAFFECNGLRLMLSLPEKDAFAHASSVIYFQVNDIHSYYNMLLNKHVTFVDQPHLVAKLGSTETWMTFFQDTEGNTLALMSEYDNPIAD